MTRREAIAYGKKVVNDLDTPELRDFIKISLMSLELWDKMAVEMMMLPDRTAYKILLKHLEKIDRAKAYAPRQCAVRRINEYVGTRMHREWIYRCAECGAEVGGYMHKSVRGKVYCRECKRKMLNKYQAAKREKHKKEVEEMIKSVGDNGLPV